MPYVTGAGILAVVGKDDPASADEDWADLVAAAIEAAIAVRLDGTTPDAGFDAELARSALLDGAAAYAERRSPHGILSVGPDAEAVRLGADILRATNPVLRRHLLPGIG